MVAADLFCGIGGLTRGLSDAGIKVLKGYDFDADAKETYEKNNKGSSFFSIDVSNLKGKELLDGIDRKNNYFLLAGCAPCQPFSLINQSNKEEDERKDLLLQFGRLIKETSPDFIFMENVPGLMNGKGKHIFRKFISILDKQGYYYDYALLNTMNYEVPQRRRRLVLLGSKFSEVKIPSGSNKIITLKEVLNKYPPLDAGKKDKNILNHEARNLSKLNMQRLKLTPKNGGSRKNLPKELVLECHKKHKGHGDVYGRMSLEEVSPTLTCKCTCISNGRFGHPTQNRAISVREAAAIQTFEDDYEFFGNMGQNTKWVGNAVPVKFAKVFGNYFMQLKDNL
ncbi:DNA cytosine methyltransferase [archaeon]|nr:DNA cytosine methyltransferase [archaeon]